ncbi:peptidylprolyl isomerase [Adlercreutzia sp. ZJ154]|uniref:FKBP-type peptidyl-prolyl cis-trans isomerase n=1 Tax=Adlercreutzia sp. ZJ154 TaxID=2709790 RepID=UPI0013EE339D|nr:FKBP-type peptidyl-prolyl cis-trans isomerase [Adlercreutzia sp. ZJ154]
MSKNYGKKAVVKYKGTLADGSVFDSTDDKEPLEYEVGSGLVIDGFDEVVAVMKVGEKRHVHIPVKEAFGEYREDKVEHQPMYTIPNAKDIEIGKRFFFITKEGIQIPAVVTEINEGMATIDFNNPLAGKDLDFDIELVDLRD